MSTLDADVAYTEAAEATSKLHEVLFPCFSGAIYSAIIISVTLLAKIHGCYFETLASDLCCDQDYFCRGFLRKASVLVVEGLS